MCARHNVLCEKCNGVFKKGELEAHLASAHTTVGSPCFSPSHTHQVDCKCGMKVDKYFMNQHKDTECLDRNVLCDLCGLQVRSLNFGSFLIMFSSSPGICKNTKTSVNLRPVPVATANGGF